MLWFGLEYVDDEQTSEIQKDWNSSMIALKSPNHQIHIAKIWGK